jgi:hypothetical protein
MLIMIDLIGVEPARGIDELSRGDFQLPREDFDEEQIGA